MKNRHYLLGAVLGIIIVFWASSAVVDKRLDNLKNYLDERITAQYTVITELAAVTGRGGSNAQADLIVSQCSQADRDTFETLLAALDRKTLSNSELNSLDTLFSGCGYVYANRRANMVAQLDREVTAVESLSKQRAMLGDFDSNETAVKQWRELVVREQAVRDNFLMLVSLQKQIIGGLKSGLVSDSAELIDLQNDARETKDLLSVATEMASTQRNLLIKS